METNPEGQVYFLLWEDRNQFGNQFFHIAFWKLLQGSQAGKLVERLLQEGLLAG